jgi:hypothetical protein
MLEVLYFYLWHEQNWKFPVCQKGPFWMHQRSGHSDGHFSPLNRYGQKWALMSVYIVDPTVCEQKCVQGNSYRSKKYTPASLSRQRLQTSATLHITSLQ